MMDFANENPETALDCERGLEPREDGSWATTGISTRASGAGSIRLLKTTTEKALRL